MQVLVNTLVSLIFIYMIPIEFKIANFSLNLFVCFLKDYYLGAHQTIIISKKSVSQYALYSLNFSPSHSIINREQHEKYLFIQPSQKIRNV